MKSEAKVSLQIGDTIEIIQDVSTFWIGKRGIVLEILPQNWLLCKVIEKNYSSVFETDGVNCRKITKLEKALQ